MVEKSNGIPQKTWDPVGKFEADLAVLVCQYWASDSEALVKGLMGIVLNFGIGFNSFSGRFLCCANDALGF